MTPTLPPPPPAHNLTVLASPLALPDLPALLWAIAEVESGNNPAAIGKNGERTRYQIKWSTWNRYTGLGMVGCSEEAAQDVVVQYLLEIAQNLVRHGRPINPCTLYVAYRTGQYRPTLARGVTDSGIRVENLYEDRMKGAK